MLCRGIVTKKMKIAVLHGTSGGTWHWYLLSDDEKTRYAGSCAIFHSWEECKVEVEIVVAECNITRPIIVTEI